MNNLNFEFLQALLDLKETQKTHPNCQALDVTRYSYPYIDIAKKLSKNPDISAGVESADASAFTSFIAEEFNRLIYSPTPSVDNHLFQNPTFHHLLNNNHFESSYQKQTISNGYLADMLRRDYQGFFTTQIKKDKSPPKSFIEKLFKQKKAITENKDRLELEKLSLNSDFFVGVFLPLNLGIDSNDLFLNLKKELKKEIQDRVNEKMDLPQPINIVSSSEPGQLLDVTILTALYEQIIFSIDSKLKQPNKNNYKIIANNNKFFTILSNVFTNNSLFLDAFTNIISDVNKADLHPLIIHSALTSSQLNTYLFTNNFKNFKQKNLSIINFFDIIKKSISDLDLPQAYFDPNNNYKPSILYNLSKNTIDYPPTIQEVHYQPCILDFINFLKKELQNIIPTFSEIPHLVEHTEHTIESLSNIFPHNDSLLKEYGFFKPLDFIDYEDNSLEESLAEIKFDSPVHDFEFSVMKTYCFNLSKEFQKTQLNDVPTLQLHFTFCMNNMISSIFEDAQCTSNYDYLSHMLGEELDIAKQYQIIRQELWHGKNSKDKPTPLITQISLPESSQVTLEHLKLTIQVLGDLITPFIYKHLKHHVFSNKNSSDLLQDDNFINNRTISEIFLSLSNSLNFNNTEKDALKTKIELQVRENILKQKLEESQPINKPRTIKKI